MGTADRDIVSTAALDWPVEIVDARASAAWSQAGCNLCMDLHGDPSRADLVVYSDGNHYMALEDALRAFTTAHAHAPRVFYVTTPPRVVDAALRRGALRVGNLELACRPHVFISPQPVLERLAADGLLDAPVPFVRNRGVALLVARGNPRNIRGIADLARSDVRLFISNPHTETASHTLYASALHRAAAGARVTLPALDVAAAAPRGVVHGMSIHHREAPEAVADGRADAAVVFHHLALRYVRVFAERFEAVALDAVAAGDSALGTTWIATAREPGVWGRHAYDFLLGDAVTAIYAHHGLDRPA
jgi:hypothetical protein